MKKKEAKMTKNNLKVVKSAKDKDLENKEKNKALDAAISQITDNFGKGSVMKLGQQKAMDVESISTGSLSLDLALGIGGLPKGRIIEVYGPESSGKTTLANELAPLLNAKRLNADEVRKEANDWDFSEEGRKRQAKRMADFAVKLKNDGNYVVADFICPTPEARSLFPADFIIWVDTIKEGRFDDTNKMFVKPEKFDFHVTSQNAKEWSEKILTDLSKNV